MEKNICILNETGQMIGLTYPKRAKGLVKNGRAEYVNDCTIRILHTSDTTVIEDDTGGIDMSQIVDFNARDYKFDKSCTGVNVGSRTFVTDMTGRNCEIFQIGDEQWSWTQICREMDLAEDEEYIFRFAVLNGLSEEKNETAQFIIVPYDGEAPDEDDWENRYVYDLSQCRFNPTWCKRWSKDIVRVYEIPFQAGNSRKARLIFVMQHAVAGIMPVTEGVMTLPDYSYEEWLKNRAGFRSRLNPDGISGKVVHEFDQLDAQQLFRSFEQKVNDFDGQKLVQDSKQFALEMGGRFGQKFKSAMDTLTRTVKDAFPDTETEEPENAGIYHAGETLEGNVLAEVLNMVEDGGDVALNDCRLMAAGDMSPMSKSADGADFFVCGSQMDGEAFVRIVDKAGDGCKLDFSNSTIASISGGMPVLNGNAIDGVDVIMVNTTISSSAFDILMEKLGDGCRLDLRNAVIIEDSVRMNYSNKADGLFVDLGNATVPNAVLTRIKNKFEDGCVINTTNTTIS